MRTWCQFCKVELSVQRVCSLYWGRTGCTLSTRTAASICLRAQSTRRHSLVKHFMFTQGVGLLAGRTLCVHTGLTGRGLPMGLNCNNKDSCAAPSTRNALSGDQRLHFVGRLVYIFQDLPFSSSLAGSASAKPPPPPALPEAPFGREPPGNLFLLSEMFEPWKRNLGAILTNGRSTRQAAL